jgi:hypothetical protein
MEVQKASLIVQIDGKCYAASLANIDLNLMINMIAPLYPDGQVKMIKLPEGVHFEKYNQNDQP